MDTITERSGRRRGRPLAATIACGAVTALTFGALTPLAASADEAPAVTLASEESRWTNPLVDDGSNPGKIRTIVTTDPELDDMNSLLRMFLYANEIDIEGLVYASSQHHWIGDPAAGVAPFRWPAEGDRLHIDTAIDAYAEVYPNLVKHDSEYPSPDELRSIVKVGNWKSKGDMAEDTEGSDFIKAAILDDEPGQLVLQSWGGPSTVARALKSIQDQYQGSADWSSLQQKISEKVVLTSFGQQDDTFTTYIRPNWPNIQQREVATSIWGYGARGSALPEWQVYLSPEWTRENVSNVGALGREYRVWGDGKQMAAGFDDEDYFGLSGYTAQELRDRGYGVWTAPQPKDAWISEGDSSNFALLIQNGLRNFEDPSWGGWGGRQAVSATDPHTWSNRGVQDIGPAGTPRNDYSAGRWFEDFQLDFAARLQWSVNGDTTAVNHEPELAVSSGISVNAKPGQALSLTSKSTDPDGDALSTKWWQYAEADTYAGAVAISGSNTPEASLTVPSDAPIGSTIHVIAEVADDGAPSMTSYQRVVITVVDSYAPQIAEQPAPRAATDGTDSATLAGIELFTVDSVSVGGTVVDDVSVNAAGTQLTFPVPTSETSGDVTMEARVGGTSVAESVLEYVAPSITKVSPGTVDVSGGIDVTIRGTGLATVEGVLIGSKPATDVSVNSAGTVVTATAPSGQKGTVDVTVALAGADAQASNALKYSSPATATAIKLTVSTKRPVFGKNSVTLTATVKGAKGGKVEFFDRGTKVGSASVSSAGVAKRTLSHNNGELKPGLHAFTAKYLGNADFAPSASTAVPVTVVKATPGKVTVKGSKFTAGKRPSVTVKVAKLNNGKTAKGKVEISVNGQKVKTVTLKSGGEATVKLPKKYSASIAVKVKYLGNSTTEARSSSTTVVRVKR